MPNRRRRSGAGKSKLAKATHAIMKAELHRRLRGVVITPSPDPPAIKFAPWFQMTLVHLFTQANIGEFTMTISKLISDLKTQLGLTTNSGVFFMIRVVKVRVWFEIAGVDIPSTGTIPIPGIKLLPHSFLGDGAMSTVTDYPSNVQWAKCGFQWPDSQQAVIWKEGGSYTSDIVYKCYFTAPASASDARRLLIYTDVMWSIDNTNLPNEHRHHETPRRVAPPRACSPNPSIAQMSSSFDELVISTDD